MSTAAKVEKLQRGQHRAKDLEAGAALAGALRCGSDSKESGKTLQLLSLTSANWLLSVHKVASGDPAEQWTSYFCV